MANDRVQARIDLLKGTDQTGEVKSSLSSVGSALSQIGNIAAGIGLERLAEQFISVAKSAFTAATAFEQNTTALGTVLGNIGKSSSDTADTFAAAGGRMKNTARDIADEMYNYGRRIEKINDDLAEVLSGKNILDQQKQVMRQLDDLAYSHANRLQDLQESLSSVDTDLGDKKADRQQGMNERLLELQEDHQLKMKGLNAFQQKVEEKQFQEKLGLERAQLQRRLDEQNKQDEEAAAKRKKQLQKQIDDENVEYNRQQQKLKQLSEERLSELRQENDKKLSMYKEELADEERAHKEHLEKLQEAVAGAADKIIKPLTQDSPFKAIGTNLKDELAFLDDLAPKSPFNYTELVQSDRLMTAMGVNGKKLIPVIGDIAASFGESLGTGTQAVLGAMNGRLEMLHYNFGIGRQELEKFGAKFSSMGQLMDQNSLFTALEKIRDAKYLDGQKKQMDTFNGALSNMGDQWFRITEAILGVNTRTGDMDKNGLFVKLKNILTDLGNWVQEHKDEIVGFFKTVADKAVDLANRVQGTLIPGMMGMYDWFEKNKWIIGIVAGILGGALVLAIVALVGYIGGVVFAIAGFVTSAVGIATIIGGVVVGAIALAILYWDQLKTTIYNVGTWIKGFAIDIANSVIDMINGMLGALEGFINGAAKLASKIPGVKMDMANLGRLGRLEGGNGMKFDVGSALVGGAIGGMSGIAGAAASYMTGSNNKSVNITNNNNFSSASDPMAFASYQAWQINGR